jgi:hypothetical protein
MARFLSVLLWTAVFLLLLIGIDQLLVRLPASLPAHVAVATFYRDLRSRVFSLAKGGEALPAAPAPTKPSPPSKRKGEAKSEPGSIEAVIGQREARPAASSPEPATQPTRPATKKSAATNQTPRYVYADEQGELHFAGTLAEIPDEFRAKAKPLGE